MTTTALPEDAELCWHDGPDQAPTGYRIVRWPMGDDYHYRIEVAGEFDPPKVYILMWDDTLTPTQARKIALALLCAADDVERLSVADGTVQP